MMRGSIMAIDPGTLESAWIKMIGGVIQSYGKDRNDSVLRKVQQYAGPGATVVCEQIESTGMPVGATTFETVRWCGRFEQAFTGSCDREPEHWYYLPRRAVKLELCGSPRANDATIRQAVIDLYGGKDRGIGRKAAPGPLYGISADVWQALAVGITHIRQRQPAWAPVAPGLEIA